MSPRPGHTSPSGDTGSAGSRHPPRSRVCRAGSSGGRSSPQHRGRHRWRGGRRSHWHRSSSVHTSFRSGREGTGAGRWGHGSLGCRCTIHPQESTTLHCGTRRAGGSLGPRSPVHPGRQWHSPVMGSQPSAWSHSQRCPQPAPNVPFGQDWWQRGPCHPGVQLQTPLWALQVAPWAQSQL